MREAAIEWLQLRTDGGNEPLTRDDILDFHFADETVRLQAPMQGIWKPRGYQAALSFRTAYTKPGEKPPYEDATGSDGLFRYKWRGTDPNHPENVGLRAAMKLRLPLIWFLGVAMSPARYQVIAPVYIVGEEPEKQQFAFTAAEDAATAFELSESAHEVVAADISSVWQRQECISQHSGQWFYLHTKTVALSATLVILACLTQLILSLIEMKEE